jgi:hypothetical protein
MSPLPVRSSARPVSAHHPERAVTPPGVYGYAWSDHALDWAAQHARTPAGISEATQQGRDTEGRRIQGPPLREVSDKSSHGRCGGRSGSRDPEAAEVVAPPQRVSRRWSPGWSRARCPLPRCSCDAEATPRGYLGGFRAGERPVSALRCCLSQLTAGWKATLRCSGLLPRVATRTREPRRRGT